MRRIALEANRRKIKKNSEELTCSFAGAAAAAEGATTAAEVSAFLFFASILVKAFGAAAADSGAPDVFSFSTSGPELTDLANPVFGFFAGGASRSPSSSLKAQKIHYHRHKEDLKWIIK